MLMPMLMIVVAILAEIYFVDIHRDTIEHVSGFFYQDFLKLMLMLFLMLMIVMSAIFFAEM